MTPTIIRGVGALHFTCPVSFMQHAGEFTIVANRSSRDAPQTYVVSIYWRTLYVIGCIPYFAAVQKKQKREWFVLFFWVSL